MTGIIVRKIAFGVLRLLALLALAGFLGAFLIMLSPGAGVDERELDSRYSAESLRHIRDSRASSGPLGFAAGYLLGIFQGDLGWSVSFDRPVRELIAGRVPVTLRSVVLGLVWGWAAALLLAVSAALARSPVYDAVAALLAGQFLCLPSALIALLLFLAGAPPAAGIAAVLFPRIFRYAHDLLAHSAALPHVVAARARGVHALRVVVRHVAPQAAPQLLALAGVSCGIALGATIPVEVMCDSPGIGQLAWKAAMARDLPLLVTLTLLIAAVTLSANLAADLLAPNFPGKEPA